MARKPLAIQLLTEDHQNVKELLEQLAESTSRAVKKRTSLLEKIGAELRAHGQIEEQIFYPALLEAAKTEDDRKMVHEAFEEHRAAVELVLPDLESTDPGSAQFGGRAKVLKELVEHHADEEEKEMFPQAKKLLSTEELDELGERMKERKQQLLQELEA